MTCLASGSFEDFAKVVLPLFWRSPEKSCKLNDLDEILEVSQSQDAPQEWPENAVKNWRKT